MYKRQAYDDIVSHGQGPDWAEVLAVFAVHTAGSDGGVDVVTLDQDRVDRLKAVFWDMTEITSKVETIDHPGGEDSEGWTESIPVSYTHLDVYKRQVYQ